MPKKLTTEEFIKRAKEIHDNKYDYSLVEYKNTDLKVKIICPIHGVFEQTPHDHLRCHGCFKCGSESSTNSRKSSSEEFVKKAKRIHGDRYDYSLVDYKNNSTKVKIICPIHGVFEQIPYIHLKPCGCPKCSENVKLSTKEFIKKAKEIFNNYDYSKVEYIHNSKKVKIICPKHGAWQTRPRDLLNGHGCPKCNESKGERRIREWLLKHNFQENVDFVCQKKFEDCKDKRPLPFDFYFQPLDLLIEFQGVQHFKPAGYYLKNIDKFTKVQEHDKIKKDYAEKHHNFLEISYKDFDNIETILETTIYKN